MSKMFLKCGKSSHTVFLIAFIASITLECFAQPTAPQISINLMFFEGDGYVQLNWEPVEGAASYYIYASANADSTDWGEPIATVGDTIFVYNEPVNDNRARFYYVTACGDTGIPQRMVLVTGGTFTMGDTRDSGREDETPTHRVTLSPFYIGKYEVTQEEFTAIMGYNPSYFVGEDGLPLYRNLPVENVNWYTTLVYCNRLSIAEGYLPVYSIRNSTDPDDWGEIPTLGNAVWNAVVCNWNANGYRLPTESEWEYAARGATEDWLYSGGDEINDFAWHSDNAGPGLPGGRDHPDYGTHPVGQKQSNRLALYDMSGNVREWCWDLYGSYTEEPKNNPRGATLDTQGAVRRGGSYYSWLLSNRVSSRDQIGRHYRYTYQGFRVVRNQ